MLDEKKRKNGEKLHLVDGKREELKNNTKLFIKDIKTKHAAGDMKVVSNVKSKLEDLTLKRELTVLRKNE